MSARSARNRDSGDSLSEFLHAPRILDGATGTELTRRGVPTPIPLWSTAALLSAPQTVQAIHREYVAAGADILTANTFRTNPRALLRAGLRDRGPELSRLAVQLARDASGSASAGRRVLVAASVAPAEDCYRPDLTPDERELRAEHAELAQWLADARPDLLWIETMGTVREALAAAIAARDVGVPFSVCFALNEAGQLLSGESLDRAIERVEPLGPLAVGLNCLPPEGLCAALPRLRRLTKRPIAAYAHIGNPEPTCGWSFSQNVGPEAYAAYARRWLDAGASVIGGCCGTTPAHVAALARDMA